MSRLACWGLLTGASLAMWGLGFVGLDTFTACTWFSGLALFVHWTGEA